MMKVMRAMLVAVTVLGLTQPSVAEDENDCSNWLTIVAEFTRKQLDLVGDDLRQNRLFLEIQIRESDTASEFVEALEGLTPSSKDIDKMQDILVVARAMKRSSLARTQWAEISVERLISRRRSLQSQVAMLTKVRNCICDQWRLVRANGRGER